MEPIYSQEFYISEATVDRFGRLKPSMLLYFAQEAAGRHFDLLQVDHDAMERNHLFWAIIRNRVQITRLPRIGETITVQTWPMPTTRTAYPRSMIAYDSKGQELFRSISLWVLMDLNTRAMVLPGKSGITVTGTLRGNELAAPGSILPKVLENSIRRTVFYSQLDRNGHMNNTRYLDWVEDLLPSAFHAGHSPREFTICYLSEATEGQQIDLTWQVFEGNCLQVDAHRTRTNDPARYDRVFSLQMLYE
ncbi:MAG: hypothetical protein IJB17_03490 [Oscillospiraceae bacterium]|nr:hypothetical protein [Oscillospiraceae bacterium]